MIRIALDTLRTRFSAFIGSFIALALGVGMMSTIAVVMFAGASAPDPGPVRFAAAPVVVIAPDLLSVPVDGDTQRLRLARPPAVPATVLVKLSALGPVTVDRSVPVQVTGVPAAGFGHPWPVARFGPYTLAGGRAPGADTEVVLAGGAAAPGDRVVVHTPRGRSEYTVAGVASGPAAVFFTESEAARLWPDVDAVVTEVPADQVRAAVGGDAQVLTGQDRRLADPDPDRHRKALLNMNIFLGVAGGLAAFVAIFVVSSTFAFAVVQRRRELALLRTIGSTARQIRRMVLAEAAILGAAGAATGCVLGLAGSPALSAWLVAERVAPSGFQLSVKPVPLVSAFLVGLAVALAGAAIAARRAAATPPIEAMRDAAVDTAVMTRGRWWWGVGLLGSALIGMAFVALKQPALATVQVIYLWIMILPVAALALLTPALLPVLVRVIVWPFTRLRGAVGLLVQENMLAAMRRTAATTAPVLLTVGLSVTLLGAVATTDQAAVLGQASRLRADFVVQSQGAAGLGDEVLNRVRAVPGVQVDTRTPTTLYVVQDGDTLRDLDADAVEPAALGRALNLTVLSGSLSDLDDGGIVVTESWESAVGERVGLWLADGTPVTLEVAAVIAPGIGGPDAYLTRRHAGRAAPQQAYVTVDPGASVPVAALADATAGFGAAVTTRAEGLAAARSTRQGSSQLGLYITLLVTAVYSAIAIVNTMVMAAAARRRELAVLRLAGATSRQVVGLVTAEALVVAGIGILLAAAATGLNLLALGAALAQLVGSIAIVVPWVALAATAVGSAVLALLGAVLTIRIVLVAPAVELVGIRE